jgi:hypothetical protein
MAKLSSTMWIFIAILIIGAVIVGLMGTGYIKSDFSSTSTTTPTTYSPLPQQQQQQGGKRNKKSSKTITTTGIYLLLAGILVGYITSKIV